MRTGISLNLADSDRDRLYTIVADRNTPQKHVWRAQIVLLTASGLGTNTIIATTGKSKTCVWRWQERFMMEGVDGLLRDKTRPPGKPSVAADRTAEMVRLTLAPPPHASSDVEGCELGRLDDPRDLEGPWPCAASLAAI